MGNPEHRHTATNCHIYSYVTPHTFGGSRIPSRRAPPVLASAMSRAIDAQTGPEANAQASQSRNALMADTIPAKATPEQAATAKAKNALVAVALMVP